MAASPAKERRRSRSATIDGVARALTAKHPDALKAGPLALSSLAFVQANEGTIVTMASPAKSPLLALPAGASPPSSSSKPNRSIFCVLSKSGELSCYKMKGEKLVESVKIADAKGFKIFRPFAVERTRVRPSSLRDTSSAKSKKKSGDSLQTKRSLHFPFLLEFGSTSLTLLAGDNGERQSWMNAIATFLSAEASPSKSGWLLTKTSADDAAWKREYLVLDYAGSKLKIYANKIAAEQNPGQVSNEVPLNPISSLKTVNADNGSSFELHLETPSAVRHLQAISAEDRDDWFNRLNQVQQKNEPFHNFSPPADSVTSPPLSGQLTSPRLGSPSLLILDSDSSAAASSSSSSSSSTSTSTSSETDNVGLSASASSSALAQTGPQVLLDYSKITFGNRLAGGAFGTVYKGEYNGITVAIKVLKDLDEASLKGFKAELEVLAMFVDSPYIIRSYGGCVEPKPCMVLEFATGGALPSWLKEAELSFTLKDVYLFATDIARGLVALHTATPQILHRDLKSLNVLVQETPERPVCKLCDFGLARFNTAASSETLLTLRGTYEYVAPEVLGKTAYVAASDIYSYGIILYELMNRAITGKYSGPYENLKMPSVAILVRVMRGTRPPIPPSCPDMLKALIELCWDAKPDVRPSAPNIIELLDAWNATLQ